MFTASGYTCISPPSRPCPFAIIVCITVVILHAFRNITCPVLPWEWLRHRRVGWLSINKCRYGSDASVKFRLGKIFLKSLVPGQKSDQNPTITRHVFKNFKVQKSQFLMSGPLFVFVHSLIKCYALFIKKSPKTLCLTKVTSKSLMPRQNLTPEKPNTCAGTSVTTFSGSRTLPPWGN